MEDKGKQLSRGGEERVFPVNNFERAGQDGVEHTAATTGMSAEVGDKPKTGQEALRTQKERALDDAREKMRMPEDGLEKQQKNDQDDVEIEVSEKHDNDKDVDKEFKKKAERVMIGMRDNDESSLRRVERFMNGLVRESLTKNKNPREFVDKVDYTRWAFMRKRFKRDLSDGLNGEGKVATVNTGGGQSASESLEILQKMKAANGGAQTGNTSQTKSQGGDWRDNLERGGADAA